MTPPPTFLPTPFPIIPTILGMHRFVSEQHRETYGAFYREFTGRTLGKTLVMSSMYWKDIEWVYFKFGCYSAVKKLSSQWTEDKECFSSYVITMTSLWHHSFSQLYIVCYHLLSTCDNYYVTILDNAFLEIMSRNCGLCMSCAIHMHRASVNPKGAEWDSRLHLLYSWLWWLVYQPCSAWVNEFWGPHTVDRLASHCNMQLPRFNSCFMCPGGEAVEAFTVEWSGENNWWFPPSGLIPRVLRHAEVV